MVTRQADDSFGHEFCFDRVANHDDVAPMVTAKAGQPVPRDGCVELQRLRLLDHPLARVMTANQIASYSRLMLNS